MRTLESAARLRFSVCVCACVLVYVGYGESDVIKQMRMVVMMIGAKKVGEGWSKRDES